MPLKDPLAAARYTSAYRKKNRALIYASNLDYRKRNGELLRAAGRKRYKRVSKTPEFVVMSRVINRIQSERKRGRCPYLKNVRELTGCKDWGELARYIESRFKPGMSWENKSLWHIDHETPFALFDLTRLDHQKACFHYSNMRPMWARENLKKGHHDPASEHVLRLKAELDEYRRLYGPLQKLN